VMTGPPAARDSAAREGSPAVAAASSIRQRTRATETITTEA